MNLLFSGSLEFCALRKEILSPAFNLGVLEFWDTAVEETLEMGGVGIVVLLVFECLRGHLELVEILHKLGFGCFCVLVFLAP